jgi:multidrug efflux pump
MRIWLEPGKMSSLNVTSEQIDAALRRNNFLSAVGRTKGADIQVDLLANTDLRTPEEFEQLIVRELQGSTVRLKDVARVELGSEEPTGEAGLNGRPAIYLSVWPLPRANELEVAARLRAKMDQLRPTLPAGVEMQLAYDGTYYMDNALKEISKTLVETVAIVGLVVFLFMGSLRSVLIPIVAMPLSLVGAMALMYAFGFTINLLTLLAIVLAVGIVVDDAIVVVENIERHIAEGKSQVEAAILGARELVGPVISMTITLAAVYAPIAFQGGLTGALFREFAMTLAGAVTVSGFVALTLSPMMSSKLVRGGKHSSGMKLKVDRFFDALQAGYARRWCLACTWPPSALRLLDKARRPWRVRRPPPPAPCSPTCPSKSHPRP